MSNSSYTALRAGTLEIIAADVLLVVIIMSRSTGRRSRMLCGIINILRQNRLWLLGDCVSIMRRWMYLLMGSKRRSKPFVF
jgi:hypothetical protein